MIGFSGNGGAVTNYTGGQTKSGLYRGVPISAGAQLFVKFESKKRSRFRPLRGRLFGLCTSDPSLIRTDRTQK